MKKINQYADFDSYFKAVIQAQFGEKSITKKGFINKNTLRGKNFKNVIFGNSTLSSNLQKGFKYFGVGVNYGELQTMFARVQEIGILNKGLANELNDYITNYSNPQLANLLGYNITISKSINKLLENKIKAQSILLNGYASAHLISKSAVDFFASLFKQNPIEFHMEYYSKWTLKDFDVNYNPLAAFNVPFPTKVEFRDMDSLLGLVNKTFKITDQTQIDTYIDKILSLIGSEDILDSYLYFDGVDSFVIVQPATNDI